MKISYDNILYATDLSPAARQAMRHAVSLAERFGSNLTVLHVLPDQLETFSEEAGVDLAHVFGEEAARWVDAGDTAKAVDAVRKRLESVHEGIAPAAGEKVVVVSGDPAECIVEQVRAGGHDLVVMGTHGHGGFMDLVFGSVARRTVKRSPVPVLVVPLPDGAPVED